MRLAYADPPYLGNAWRYPEHPDAADWDDACRHADLMAELDATYDGWAYSCLSTNLPVLLPLAPAGVRIAAWVKPFAAFKRNVRVSYTWEPVLFKPGRDSTKLGAPLSRDHLAEPITLQRGLVGAKPERFCRWVLNLLGYVDGDELVDLFPGSGVMARVLAQPTLDVNPRAERKTPDPVWLLPAWEGPHSPQTPIRIDDEQEVKHMSDQSTEATAVEPEVVEPEEVDPANPDGDPTGEDIPDAE